MLLIIGIHFMSVACYNSICIIFFVLPTRNIYTSPTVLDATLSKPKHQSHMSTKQSPK